MFDPYHKWLGILPKDQPPNHYRLLGVELYEEDLDVIEGAADRQMGFVRQYQSGEYASQAAKILNELAIARLCLLKPVTKTAYDAKLRLALAPPEPEFPDLPFSTGEPVDERAPKKGKKKSAKANASGIPQPLMIGGGIAIVAIAILAVFLFSGRPKPRVENPTKPDSIATTNPTKSGVGDVKPASVVSTDSTPSNAVAWSDSKLVTEPVGKPIDLLKLVNISRDVASGDWQQTTTAIVGAPNSRLYLPAKSPEDYQLDLSVRRLDGNEAIVIGFMMGGRQGMIAFDGWGSTRSGLFVDGRDARDNATAWLGPLFKDQSTARIVLTVHPDHLHAMCDGKTIVDWHGNPERLLLDSFHQMACRESPLIALSLSKFVIESASLTPIKSESPHPRPARLDREFEVLPLVDLDRDVQRGIWAISKNTLSSPDGAGRIYLPTVVPEEYTLSATIELPAGRPGDYGLTLGLVADKSYFQFTSTGGDSGLDTIDGRRWNDNETRLRSPVLKPGIPVQVACTVTKGGIRVEANGKTLVDWRGDVRRLSMPGDWALADARRLFLGSSHHLKFRDIKLGPPIAPPKLPDHPPVSVGKGFDLLSVIDPARDAIAGTWERDGTSLRCKGDVDLNKLVIPFDVPDEYKLSMRIARSEGGRANNECLYVGLPIGQVKTCVVIDGAGSSGSGLTLDSKTASYQGSVIPTAAPHNLVFIVRKTGFQMISEGKTLIDWTGNPEGCSFNSDAATPGRMLSLGSWRQGFRFERLELEPLPATSFPAAPQVGADGKLLPIVNVDRDARRGDWKRNDEGLTTPKIKAGRLRIPAPVPDRYVLTADLERKEGTDAFDFGMPVGGHPCSVELDGSNGTRSALTLLDGKSLADPVNFTHRFYKSAVLPLGKRVKVRCLVMPDTVVVTCDDLEVIRWHGDARRLSAHPAFAPPNVSNEDDDRIWIGTWETVFLVRDLQLHPMSNEQAAELAASFEGVFPLTPQSDVALAKAKLSPESTTSPTSPAAPTTPGSTPTVAQPAKLGEWVDLLEWAEGVDWAPRGMNWNEKIEGKATRSGITLKRAQAAQFPLPAIIDGDYEMEVKFTRLDGNHAVAIHFPVGIHTMRLLLGNDEGAVSRLDFVDGQIGGERRPAPISNNEPHRILIHVRHEGEKASIDIDWDEIKNYITWDGESAALTNVDPSIWKTTMLLHPWIGSTENNLVFQTVRARMQSGTIRRDVITETDRTRDFKNGFVRLVGEEANAVNAYDGLFSVNQLLLKAPGEVEYRWPLISRDFKNCDDYYGAHAASRLKCPIPTGAKSFSVIGYNAASRTAKFQIVIDGNQVQDSRESGIAIMKVNIPAKSSLLELVADPVGSHLYDQTYWCFPRFHSMTAERLTDKMLDSKSGPLKFSVASGTVGFGELTRNEPVYGQTSSPVHFRDAQPCDEFLFAHAPSTVTYLVPEGMTRFTAIGYSVLNHHVKYEVWADSKRVYESPQAGVIPIDVKLPPRTKTIELKINDLGDLSADHSMWCYPRLYRK